MRYPVSGYPTYRPTLPRDPMAPEGQRNLDNYFNKATVIIPVDPLNPDSFGNSGRNTIRTYPTCRSGSGLHQKSCLKSGGRS